MAANKRAPNSIDTLIGLRIAALRQQLGLSQTALGEKLGLSFQQIQKYEAGANRVSASRLHLIALTLGAPVSAFLPGTTTIESAPHMDMTPLMTLAASPEGRALADAFPRIENRETRRAVACIVRALATA